MVNLDTKNISKALVEVSEILMTMDDDEFERIPLDVLDYIEENKDKNYIWKYDESISFDEQNLSEYTLEILTYITMEYILEDEEKRVAKEWFMVSQEVDELNSKNNILKEEKKLESENQVLEKEEIISENLPIVQKKQNIFQRIIEKIRNIFNR